MGRFTFDFGWSRRVPEHEGSLCRVLEIHAPGSLLEYGGSAVEIQSWGSLAFWHQDNPEAMSDSEVLEVDAKLDRKVLRERHGDGGFAAGSGAHQQDGLGERCHRPRRKSWSSWLIDSCVQVGRP